jgi:DNA-binding NarL/FixJ family response regulator
MKITIFLADDHTVVSEGIRLLLETQADFQVAGEAGDGREAVHRIIRLNPRVALLDIAMPQLNGIETNRQLREQGSDTRVIILSMHATSEHVFQALKAGAWGYLVKESAGAEVVKAVREVHGGRRYISQNILDIGTVSGP